MKSPQHVESRMLNMSNIDDCPPSENSLAEALSGPRGTDQSPAELTRALQDEAGFHRTNQGLLSKSGPTGTNQGPARRIRAPQDRSAPSIGIRKTSAAIAGSSRLALVNAPLLPVTEHVLPPQSSGHVLNAIINGIHD